MSGCEKCKDLNTIFRISMPGDLKQAIRVAKDNVADGTISVIENAEKISQPFFQLSESGTWDDIVHYEFKCNSCGQKFHLVAETYHGTGGEWKPI